MFGTGFPDDWSALKRLIWLRLLLAQESGSWQTASGSSPLSLVNSLAHALQSLTQYGKCVQDGTPTPDVPVDIVCNNGAIKTRHQSGLPLGYTLLAYARSSGTQYIDLGYKGNGNTKVDVKFKYHTASSAIGSGRVFGSRTTSQSDAFAIGTSSGLVATATNQIFWCYDSQPYYVDGGRFELNVWKTVVFSAKAHSIDGVSVGDDYEIVSFETPENLKLFGFDQNGGTMGVGYVDVAYCKLWDNGVLARDLVPAKNASNVVGMYDFVSGQFLTNAGTGDFVAGDPVDDPVEIYADGTPEVLTVGGTNLVDLTAVLNGFYYGPSGVLVEANVARLTDFIPVTAGQKYTVYVEAQQGGAASNVRCNMFDTEKVWKSQSVFVVTTGSSAVSTITPAEDGFLRVSANYTGAGAKVDWSTLQIVFGEYTLATMPPYQPYVTPQTVSVPMLLGVGDYADTVEIISGGVKRKVGIKVLDGTENYARRSDYAINFSELGRAYGNGIAGICTHFQCIASNSMQSPVGTLLFNMSNNYIHFFTEYGGDVAAFKAWLAAQYASGTPVIVVYPLATETTEQGTPHSLHSYAGTTIIEAQTNVDPVTLACEYMGVSA